MERECARPLDLKQTKQMELTMKKTNLGSWAVALLCGTLQTALWADDSPKSTEYQRQSASPNNINKASSLVGMEVRNQSDEKLGKIEDLVLDLNSGRISYAVLNAGTAFRSKLVAVPVSAFTASSDQKHLLLNADKAKLEAAKGFDKNMWPSVSNPDWGADTFLDKPATDYNRQTRPGDPYRQPKPEDKPDERK
jgi:sporulation protein YlmC with PRC-barrel domain